MAFLPILGRVCRVSPRGDQLGKASALVFLVLDDQYFFLGHPILIIQTVSRLCKRSIWPVIPSRPRLEVEGSGRDVRMPRVFGAANNRTLVAYPYEPHHTASS